jgi:hypothetical protein
VAGAYGKAFSVVRATANRVAAVVTFRSWMLNKISCISCWKGDSLASEGAR